MEYTEHYDNMRQRDTIVKDYESRGFRMLHDDFDEDWKKGDEPHGTLTFTDEPIPTILTEPVMDYKAEILKLQDEVKKLKEKD